MGSYLLVEWKVVLSQPQIFVNIRNIPNKRILRFVAHPGSGQTVRREYTQVQLRLITHPLDETRFPPKRAAALYIAMATLIELLGCRGGVT